LAAAEVEYLVVIVVERHRGLEPMPSRRPTATRWASRLAGPPPPLPIGCSWYLRRVESEW